MSNVINFYRTNEEYGCFSNFSQHSVLIDKRRWPTTEHYFQAMKFRNKEIQEAIRRANSPGIAARMGRSRKRPLRKDWESVKIGVMRKALMAKFTQHDDLREILLGTGNAKLVEHTSNDRFWGDGGDGSGKNWLGRLLVEVRGALRQEDENE